MDSFGRPRRRKPFSAPEHLASRASQLNVFSTLDLEESSSEEEPPEFFRLMNYGLHPG